MEGIRMKDFQAGMISTVIWLPLEANKTFLPGSELESCVNNEFMRKSQGPKPISRDLTSDFIYFSERFTVPVHPRMMNLSPLSSGSCQSAHLSPVCKTGGTLRPSSRSL